DKRERIVYLSPQAKKKLPEIQQEIERLEENLLIALSDSEQDQLISLLKKICKSTEKGEMNDEPAGANLD
ncbi:MAG: MarR family transcriptional regulator, partial [Priestia megaterium]